MLDSVRRRRIVDVLTWAVVIWVVVFWRLGYLSLLDPDEAHYAQLTREMIRARQWMVPVLEGVPFIDKPVLYHWLQAAAEWCFGETELALRLPSACAAVALFWTVRWAGGHLFDPQVGRRAALMFATTPLTFALASIGVFDMVFTAFLFGAVASLLVAAQTGRRFPEVAGWLLLALAVMVKGPVAVLLVVLLGVALWAFAATRPLVQRLHWFIGLFAVALLAAPWFAYMAWAYPRQFVRDYLLAGNLYYFTRPDAFSTRRSDSLFYLRTYLGACFPWSVLALGAAIDTFTASERPGQAERALWTWTVLIIGFFSIAGFKLDTYIFPAAPATCLLVANALRTAKLKVPLRATTIAIWVSCAALLIGGVVLAATMFQIDLGVSVYAAALPAALILGSVVAVIRLRTLGPSMVPATLMATLLVAYGVVIVEGFPVLERSRPTAPIGHWVDRHTPLDAPVGVYGLDDWRSSIRFYTRRSLVVVHDQAELTTFLDAHPDSYVLMRRSDVKSFREAGVPLKRVGGRRAIVGRSGKYIRRQVWGRIVVTTRGDRQEIAGADLAPELDLPER